MRGERYSSQADVYSFGMTVLTMSLMGKFQLPQFLADEYTAYVQSQGSSAREFVTPGRVAHRISNFGWRPTNNSIPLLPSTIWSLINICWQNDPRDRPHFSDCVDFLSTDANDEVRGLAAGESKEAMIKSAFPMDTFSLKLATIKESPHPTASDESDIGEQLSRQRDQITFLLQEKKELERKLMDLVSGKKIIDS